MKRPFLNLIVLLTILFSCNSSDKSENLSEANKITVDTAGNSLAEKKLKTQLNEYLVAINGGDPDKALEYIYPDVFLYMKETYPDEYDIEKLKEEMREPIRKMKQLVDEKKVSYDLEIGDVTKRISDGDNRIYLIIANINAKMGLNRHTIGQKIISISNDNGANWKFMEQKNEMAEPILKMKFSDKVVNEIMEK